MPGRSETSSARRLPSMCLDTVSTIEGGGKGIGVARAVHRLRAKQKTMKRNFMVGDSLGGVAQRSAKQELHSELERSEGAFIPSSFHRRGFECCGECHCGSHASFSEVAPRSSVARIPSCRRDVVERSVAGREQIDVTIDEVEFAEGNRSSPRVWLQRRCYNSIHTSNSPSFIIQTSYSLAAVSWAHHTCCGFRLCERLKQVRVHSMTVSKLRIQASSAVRLSEARLTPSLLQAL